MFTSLLINGTRRKPVSVSGPLGVLDYISTSASLISPQRHRLCEAEGLFEHCHLLSAPPTHPLPSFHGFRVKSISKRTHHLILELKGAQKIIW